MSGLTGDKNIKYTSNKGEARRSFTKKNNLAMTRLSRFQDYDQSMVSAIFANTNGRIFEISGCKGLNKEKVNDASIRILSKKDDKDGKKYFIVHGKKKGYIDAEQFCKTLGINCSENSKKDNQIINEER